MHLSDFDNPGKEKKKRINIGYDSTHFSMIFLFDPHLGINYEASFFVNPTFVLIKKIIDKVLSQIHPGKERICHCAKIYILEMDMIREGCSGLHSTYTITQNRPPRSFSHTC
jgi:hypothetical protein